MIHVVVILVHAYVKMLRSTFAGEESSNDERPCFATGPLYIVPVCYELFVEEILVFYWTSAAGFYINNTNISQVLVTFIVPLKPMYPMSSCCC